MWCFLLAVSFVSLPWDPYPFPHPVLDSMSASLFDGASKNGFKHKDIAYSVTVIFPLSTMK